MNFSHTLENKGILRKDRKSYLDLDIDHNIAAYSNNNKKTAKKNWAYKQLHWF